MKAVETVGQLFRTHPAKWWGFRGDPYLWDEMAHQLVDARLPDSYSEFAVLLEGTFEGLTGKKFSDTGNPYIERYAHGGMSDGLISIRFWRSKAFPLLDRKSVV